MNADWYIRNQRVIIKEIPSVKEEIVPSSANILAINASSKNVKD